MASCCNSPHALTLRCVCTCASPQVVWPEGVLAVDVDVVNDADSGVFEYSGMPAQRVAVLLESPELATNTSTLQAVQMILLNFLPELFEDVHTRYYGALEFGESHHPPCL